MVGRSGRTRQTLPRRSAAEPIGYGSAGLRARRSTIGGQMEINGLTGMTGPEPLSLLLSFLLFGAYVTAEAGSLTLFYLASAPRHGRVRTAAGWHLTASLLWFPLAIIALGVWAAPAEKSFVDDATLSRLLPFNTFDLSWRFAKVEISVLCFAVGVLFTLVGTVRAGRQRRIWQRASVPAV